MVLAYRMLLKRKEGTSDIGCYGIVNADMCRSSPLSRYWPYFSMFDVTDPSRHPLGYYAVYFQYPVCQVGSLSRLSWSGAG